MIPVKIADILKQGKLDYHVVILLDEANARLLPIWIGETESVAIAMGMRQHSVPRPMTFDLTAKLLDTATVQVEEVRVEALREDTYYAVVKIRQGESTHEVDARPSDALGLAVRVNVPIYVSDALMAQAGETIPADKTGQSPQGSGIDNLLDEFLRAVEERRHQGKEKTEAETEEEKRQNRQALMEALFG